MPKPRTHRYSIEIKDAKGSVVLSTAAVWDEHDRRIAIARILRLDGVLDANLCSETLVRQYVRQDSEGMVASLTNITPAKKKPRH
jgi:hypothetical protein